MAFISSISQSDLTTDDYMENDIFDSFDDIDDFIANEEKIKIELKNRQKNEAIKKWNSLVNKGMIKPKCIPKNLGTVTFIDDMGKTHKAEILQNGTLKDMESKQIYTQNEWIYKKN